MIEVEGEVVSAIGAGEADLAEEEVGEVSILAIRLARPLSELVGVMTALAVT